MSGVTIQIFDTAEGYRAEVFGVPEIQAEATTLDELEKNLLHLLEGITVRDPLALTPPRIWILPIQGKV